MTAPLSGGRGSDAASGTGRGSSGDTSQTNSSGSSGHTSTTDYHAQDRREADLASWETKPTGGGNPWTGFAGNAGKKV